MIEGEKPIENLRKIVKAPHKPTTLGGGRDEDDVYIHLVLILASAKHYRLCSASTTLPKYSTAFSLCNNLTASPRSSSLNS